MRFGLTLFATEATLDPAAAAGLVEQAGFDVLLFPDHTHVPVHGSSAYPGGGEMPAHYRETYDPLVACAFAATGSTRLRVGVGVCLVPARDPIVLAKQVASIDALSGGRLLLGVGTGWNAREIEDHGVRAADRWGVLRERVLAMKRIWTQDEAEFHGRHVDFDPLWSWPKPRQRPHPPISVGGHGPTVLQRVVEYGDEWLCMPSPGAPPMAERVAALRSMAEAAGRPRPSVAVQVYGTNPPDKVIERYLAAGVDRVDLGLPFGSPEVQRETLGALAEVVARWR